MSRRGLLAAAVALVLAVGGVAGVLLLRARFKRLATLFAPPHLSAHRTKTPYDAAEVVLDGKLGTGWQDWGWGPRDLPEGGSIAVGFESYGGIILRHDTLPSRFGALVFRYRAPASYGSFLEASLREGQLDEKVLPRVQVEVELIADLGNGWSEALIPWEQLNPSGVPFDRIVLQAHRPVGAELVRIDKIVLTKPAVVAAGAAAPSQPAKLKIECDKPRTRISPLIYGIASSAWATGATARRIGGNPLTRMNWDLGAWNTGSDWFFENVKGASLTEWFDDDATHHAKTALVVPMIGWVAKDVTSVGFPISKLGPQKASDPYRKDAGNGVGPNDKPLAPGPPTETSVAAPPALIRGWIETLRRKDAEKGTRSVDMYILDNEPSLWSVTHRDVHPDPLSYDDLLDRTIQYGEAIRTADPDATIAGPAEWGWTGYFFSAKDQVRGTTLRLDRRAHGDTPLVAWYLRQLSEYEKRTGHRILDVFDLHFYPQVEGMDGKNARTDAEGAAVRIRSTRALWDPEYRDESWIADNVNLIPRMKAWVQENYPGRGISIGEWNFGAEDHISGGLATAEALGRFGQGGILSAFYWTAPAPGTPAFQAFRAYRNFDGKGATFLDWSVPTRMADGVSLFASRDDTGTHLVAVLLNLDPTYAKDAEIDMSTCGATSSRRIFAYGNGAQDFVADPPRTEASTLHERIQPYSMKVLDITMNAPQGGASPP